MQELHLLFARATKRADDIRYLTQQYLREPFGNDLTSRFRQLDGEFLATIIRSTNPRERQNFLIYNNIDKEQEKPNYELGFLNTYEKDGRLSKYEIFVSVNPLIMPDYIDEDSKIAIDKLSNAALRIYRLPGTPQGWGIYERGEKDETFTVARTLGINARGRTFDVRMDTMGRANLTITESFYTPVE